MTHDFAILGFRERISNMVQRLLGVVPLSYLLHPPFHSRQRDGPPSLVTACYSSSLLRSSAPASLRASSCTEEASSTKEDHCQDSDQFTGIPQSVRTRLAPAIRVPSITCIYTRRRLSPTLTEATVQPWKQIGREREREKVLG